MQEQVKRGRADQEMLAQSLEALAGVVRSGACHASTDQLAEVAGIVNTLLSPANIMTTYQVTSELGVTSRTLYNWIDQGVWPAGFQKPGAGNVNFWYADDFKRAKKRLKELKYI